MEPNGTAEPSAADPDKFLVRIVELNGIRYERAEPITDYRRDPGEARILYLCHLVSSERPDARLDEGYVMKVKVQYACCSGSS